jgi:hypothetical protein
VLPAGASPATVVVAPGSHSYYVGPPATASIGLAGAEACVNVQVDYGNTLPETNESNNALATCRPLVTTMQLRVFFVPVALGSSPPPSCSSVQAVASRSIDFVRGTYPVADAGPRAAAAYVSCRPLAYQAARPPARSHRAALRRGPGAACRWHALCTSGRRGSTPGP